MIADGHSYTIGVEEEYQIVRADTRDLVSRASRLVSRVNEGLQDAEATHELYLSQIECVTPVCRRLDEIREAVARMRAGAIRAAEPLGLRIASCGSHPFATWEKQRVTPKGRYLSILEEFQQIAREEIIFGMHVHVGIDDPDEAIRVINRVRPWLPVILALSASSPYWMGSDSGYASYRTVQFGRMPTVDVPVPYASRADYDAMIRTLIESDCIPEPSRVYWDVRPSAHYPTIEFRIGDACPTVDETVLIAALCRSLARTCHEQLRRGEPDRDIPLELLRCAKWRAARYGLDMDLIDPETLRSGPALEVVRKLLKFLRQDLEVHGEWDEVATLTHELLERGNSARRQRAAFERSGRLEDVVALIVEETARGVAVGAG
ncbi:MAG: carboxylate-amine ligase [Isosphaeraceae bacterium]